MIVFVISFVTALQIWISAGHVTQIITMKNLKFNCQLKSRKIQGFSALFHIYSPFYYQMFGWGGGNFLPPPGTIWLSEFWWTHKLNDTASVYILKWNFLVKKVQHDDVLRCHLDILLSMGRVTTVNKTN